MQKKTSYIKKAFFFCRILFLSLLFISFLNGYAQVKTSQAITLHGQVYDKDNGGELASTITVYEDGVEKRKVTTNQKGALDIYLGIDKIVKVTFRRRGYVEKTIEFNTKNVPEADIKYGLIIPVKVYLYKDLPNIDFSILKENPIAKYRFYDKLGNLDYDRKYTEGMFDKISGVLKLYNEAIKKLEKEKKEKRAKFQKLVDQGDKDVSNQIYEEAIANFNSALVLYPEEKYPKKRIIQVNKLLEEQKEKDKEIEEVISQGDKLKNQKKYEESLSKYEKAENMLGKREKEGLKEKIKEVKRLSSGEKVKKANYDKLIAQGNKEIRLREYEKAKTSFNSALGLFPEEELPKNKLKEIEVKQKELAVSKAEYQKLISEANILFNQKKYQDAKEKYVLASGMSNADEYPSQQIRKIDGIISSNSKLDKDYEKLIITADGELKVKNYDKAKSLYKQALILKSNEEYPQNKLNAIERIIEKEKKLKDLLEEANKEYAEGNIERSKEKYKEIILINNEDSYAKEMIRKIDEELVRRNKKSLDQKKTEEQYQVLVQEADAFMVAEKYQKSIEKFREAQKVKPSEGYPKTKIDEINKILFDKEKNQQEASDMLAQLFKEAESLFYKEEYEESRNKYKNILSIESDNKKALDKISEINQIVEAQAKAQERLRRDKKRMDELVQEAEKFVKMKLYDKSKIKYMEALNIKDDDLIKEKVKKIDNFLNQEKLENEKLHEIAAKKESEYKEYLMKADNYFNNKSYDQAILNYKLALEIKPEEIYPKDQIKQAQNFKKEFLSQEEIRLKQARKDSIEEYSKASKKSEYAKVLKEADYYFKIKKYKEAKDNYEKALLYKPKEEYLISQIDKVKQLLIEKQERERIGNDLLKKRNDYDNIIKRAESYARAYNYDRAIMGFKKALELFSNEEHPKKRIKELEQLINRSKYYKNKDENLSLSPLEISKEKSIERELEKMRSEQEKEKLVNFEKKVKEYLKANSESQEEEKERIKKGMEFVKEKSESASNLIKKGEEAYPKKRSIVAEFKYKIIGRRKERKEMEEKRVKIAKQKMDEYFEKLDRENQEKAKDYLKFVAYIEGLKKANIEKHQLLEKNALLERNNRTFDYYVGEKRLRKDDNIGVKKGVTEEVERNSNNITLIRTIRVKDQVTVYKKISYTWGGIYYTKDGDNITKSVWDSESTGKNYISNNIKK